MELQPGRVRVVQVSTESLRSLTGAGRQWGAVTLGGRSARMRPGTARGSGPAGDDRRHRAYSPRCSARVALQWLRSSRLHSAPGRPCLCNGCGFVTSRATAGSRRSLIFVSAPPPVHA